MHGKLNRTSDISSEIRNSQPLSGAEREPAGGNQFAFAVKLAIIVGLVLLVFWLLDRAV